ncbi:uncharacterized protein ARMOST_07342 [Armillaria ostoyae]|uniref:DUF5648 domain-containing protein n=1 Tax=Armillaria ostoyae TaxID=47428 RepID=A0A284R5L6_ARMOS|nr:uncharacterized protein ARMOST_07342 [Armillaria ostoyae]
MPPHFITFVALGVVSATQNHTCPKNRQYLSSEDTTEGLNHFYTTSAAEIENAIMQYSEGDTALVFGIQAPGTVPLYRAFQPRGADHFYTTDDNERNNAVKNLGYNDEDVVGYIYPSEVCCSVPLYRMYNPRLHDHFYTANKKNTATQTLGYVTEGIAGYVIPV